MNNTFKFRVLCLDLLNDLIINRLQFSLTSRYFPTIGHIAMFVVKSIHIQNNRLLLMSNAFN